MEEMNDHLLGEARVWEGANIAMWSFFDDTNLPFDFADVFRRRRQCVEADLRYVITDLFESVIHQDCLHNDRYPSELYVQCILLLLKCGDSQV